MLTTELKGAGEAMFEKRNIDWLNYGSSIRNEGVSTFFCSHTLKLF